MQGRACRFAEMVGLQQLQCYMQPVTDCELLVILSCYSACSSRRRVLIACPPHVMLVSHQFMPGNAHAGLKQNSSNSIYMSSGPAPFLTVFSPAHNATECFMIAHAQLTTARHSRSAHKIVSVMCWLWAFVVMPTTACSSQTCCVLFVMLSVCSQILFC